MGKTKNGEVEQTWNKVTKRCYGKRWFGGFSRQFLSRGEPFERVRARRASEELLEHGYIGDVGMVLPGFPGRGFGTEEILRFCDILGQDTAMNGSQNVVGV
ncbi:unnamed protein product [Dicrocoelium dendriticum]|nr:unnamed protein product [Dicrocoelium dendriticum]